MALRPCQCSRLFPASVGVVLNVVAGVTRIPMADLIRASWPFMWAELVILFLMVLFPQLVTVPAKWFGG
jgi:TRAP-type C4-dicarboxylate transport system permease large subunit